MPVNSVLTGALFFCLLLAASVWDFRKRIIPDSICVAITVVGLLTFAPGKLAGILIGLPLLVAALWKEGGMGGGDVKFTTACGFVLGLPSGCAGLILGLIAALVWHIGLKTICRLKWLPITPAKTSALPLAPFLSLGFIATTILRLAGYLTSMI